MEDDQNCSGVPSDLPVTEEHIESNAIQDTTNTGDDDGSNAPNQEVAGAEHLEKSSYD